MTQDLAAEALQRRVTGSWGRSITVLAETRSTMDDAAAAARAGAPDGHVIVADRQTRGRGAHGREWSSPAGTDLYFSVVARPAIAPESMALVTLAAGLGVRNAVADVLEDREVSVKWPNDIWVGGRKCAGILVESRMSGTTIEAVILGIGLNVNRTEWPDDLRGIATSLRAERSDGEPLSRAAVLVDVLAEVERSVERLVEHGPRALVRSLRPHLALVGREVRYEGGRGVFEGIDESGAARVRTAAGLQTLHAARLELDLEHAER